MEAKTREMVHTEGCWKDHKMEDPGKKLRHCEFLETIGLLPPYNQNKKETEREEENKVKPS